MKKQNADKIPWFECHKDPDDNIIHDARSLYCTKRCVENDRTMNCYAVPVDDACKLWEAANEILDLWGKQVFDSDKTCTRIGSDKAIQKLREVVEK